MADLNKLEALHKAATPGPYRVHDHNSMARVGCNPSKWVGYAWVGRVCRDSGSNGEFDAGWFKTDRRKDGSTEYRERASADAHLIAYLCNAVPDILTLATDLTRANEIIAEKEAEIARLRERLEVVPGWSESADGISCRDDTIKLQAKQIGRLAARCGRLEEALTPSGYTKAAYIGEFKFNITLTDEDGEEYHHQVYVPWDTTKEIMKAISERAALKEPSQ